MKVSLFASTLISSTVLLTAFSGHQAFAADIVTKNNAQEVASEALSNSGGNPDLQNFGKVIDKGDYFEIKSHNKANAGLGVYKVHKNGQVEYKNDKYSNFNQLQSGETYVEHGIANAAELDDLKEEASKINSVDCARELNSYYVGNVKSNEVPSSQSVKKQKNHDSTNSQSSLPETGHSDSEQSTQLLGSIFLLLGGALVAKQSHKKIS